MEVCQMRRKFKKVPNVNLAEMEMVYEIPLLGMSEDLKNQLKRKLAKKTPECFRQKRDVSFWKFNADESKLLSAEPYIFEHMTYNDAGQYLYQLLNHIREDKTSSMEIFCMNEIIKIKHMGEVYIASFAKKNYTNCGWEIEQQ